MIAKCFYQGYCIDKKEKKGQLVKVLWCFENEIKMKTIVEYLVI